MKNLFKKLGTGLLFMGGLALLTGFIKMYGDPPGACVILNLFK